MSTRLVLLGLLKDRSFYGYELKHIIEEHMGDWTSIAFGSIYFALKKLNEQGFVEKIKKEKVGNRPSRSVYKITDKGRDEFLLLLREAWQKYERVFYPLDIALVFAKSLPKGDVINYLKNRIERYVNILEHLKEHEQEQLANPHIPKSAKAVFSHSKHHFNAELNWLKELLEDFESGDLP